MKKSILFFAALCCAFITLLPQKAQADYWYLHEVDGIYYFYSDGSTGEVWGHRYKKGNVHYGPNYENYSHLGGDVTIPEEVEGRTITLIDRGAFANKQQGGELRLTLPNSITTIKKEAFYDATKLQTITLNKGLTQMETSVFSGCSNLVSVNIPSTLTTIPVYTFERCTSLPSITLHSGVVSIDGYAFQGCTALQTVNGATTEQIWVKSIGEHAFHDCVNLNYIRLSANLLSIGEYAFSGCLKLDYIQLPANLVQIGDFAFANTGLLIVSNKSTTPQVIKANVFDGLDLSKRVLYVPKGCKEAYQNAEVWRKFGHILEPGENPGDVITIGTQQINGFYYDLHADLTASLLWHADYKKNLTGDITIPATVTYGKYTYTVDSISSNGVFKNCENITSVTLPDNITNIPDETFYSCTGMTKVKIPSALTTIGKCAFRRCFALQEVSLPLSVTEIGISAFQACNSLKSISVPPGVTVIPDSCFYSCDKLDKVKLYEGLLGINEAAFANCQSLRAITIPASVSLLGGSVFKSDYWAEGKYITSFKMLGKIPPKAQASDFFGIPNSKCFLYVPAGSKTKYEAADGWDIFYFTIREKGLTEKIEYNGIHYQLNEDFTANVIRETLDENNYKDLKGELIIEQAVNYEGHYYSVRTIDYKAFANNKNITKIVLPEILDKIEAYAFENMNLFEINIPVTLKRLSYLAFKGSTLFTTHMDEQGAVYYDGCLLYHEKDYIFGPYQVKEGTRLIASNVFSGDARITQLTLPEGLRCICKAAIDYMPALTTINIPSTVESLQEGFLSSNCEKLKTIYCYKKNPICLFWLSSPGAFAYWTKEQQAAIALYVPYGSGETYKKDSDWNGFNIMEMDPVYTVTFVDYNGHELSSEQVEKGEDATAPDDPTRDGYHFTGWDKDYTNVKSDLTVTATYAINTYTVTFYDKDGTTKLTSESVNYGDAATAPDYPEHTGYHFLYWTPEYDIITSDLDVYAQYEMNTYTVIFQDWDGTELKTFNVDHAHMINLIDMPDESSLTRECYTFKGWKSSADETLTEEQIAAAEVMHDETYTAYYEVDTYQLTFVCDHGTINLIEGAVDPDAVECGTKLHFSVTPEEGYAFDKWSFEYDELEGYEITDNTTITALMKILTYTVTFKDWDGKVLKTETVDYSTGATAPADPVREGYTFTGWDEAFDVVTSDLTVTALYEEVAKVYFTVTYYDWDMTVLGTEKVKEGHDAKGLETDPEREGYTFTGWNSSLENITSNLNVQAQYEVKKVYFTVTYFDWNMTVLGTEQVEEGHDAKGLETDPEREGYTFIGWSSSLENVTADLNVQAQYEKKEPTALDEIDWENNSAMNPDAQNPDAQNSDSRNAASHTTKFFRNGVLYILRNGILYDAAGNKAQ